MIEHMRKPIDEVGTALKALYIKGYDVAHLARMEYQRSLWLEKITRNGSL